MGPDGPGLSCPGSSVVAEGAKSKASTAPETIGPDTSSLLRSQSITEESEAVEEPIKPNQTGSFCHIWPQGSLMFGV